MFSALTLTTSLLVCSAVQDRAALVRESYEQAFGRAPQEGEVNYWVGRQDWTTLKSLVDLHMGSLTAFPDLQNGAIQAAFNRAQQPAPTEPMMKYWREHLTASPCPVEELTRRVMRYPEQRAIWVRQSYEAAFGRAGSEDEVKYWSGRNDWGGLSDLLGFHKNYIRDNDAVADEVVRNSYLRVFGRDPLPGEWNHWRPSVKAQGRICADLEYHHRDWRAKVAQPAQSSDRLIGGLKAKGMAFDVNGNIVLLAGARMDPNRPGMVAGGGGNIVHPNGTYLVGKGGAGAPEGLKARVIRSDGSAIVANDGAGLIGQDGASLIGNDGSTIVAVGGGN